MAARRAAYEQAMFGAWQTERFAREERLKPFGQYVKSPPKSGQTSSSADRPSAGQAMLAGLLAHKQAGAPMTIRRLPRRGADGQEQ